MEKYNEVKDKIPLLRFRNFQQCKSWNKGTIDSIIECESSQLTLGKLNLSDKGYPIYGADGIIGYITFYNKSHMYISIVKDGSGVGRLNLCQAYSSLLGTLNYLFSKDEKAYQIQWIYYLLQTIDFSNYIKGSGIPHIYFNDYKKHIIYIPSFDEQREIADCLSSLDELIEATAQKVETLKEHKKGLMQRLFPAEGKNVPDLRFLEFKGAEEWKESSLDEYFDFKQGFQCPVEEQYDKQEHGMVRFIRIIDLTQPSTPYRYINDPGNQYYINKENLFMVRYGDPGLVGIGYEGIIANNLFQLIPKKKINPYFFYFLFSKEKTRIKGLSSSTSLSAINFTSLKAFKIVVSQNTDEQQKIADCFSSIDELIEVISRKVEILKEHKKGLMQQLFPKI